MRRALAEEGRSSTDVAAAEVPAELVEVALGLADRLGCQVADVSIDKIAREAGISRSTLLRRLGGSRTSLDDAVRAAGVDPGGRPVRERALDAAAVLISETGVGLTTLDAVAVHAGCSIDSLFAIFGSRDELLAAVFERYSPITDLADALDDHVDQADLASTVQHAYRQFAEVLTRPPRVTPALLAEALARPTSTAVRSIVRHNAPRMLEVLGRWLSGEIKAGRIRDLPLPLLIHQFAAPLAAHLLTRPVALDAGLVDLPSIERTTEIFAEAFLRAVAVTPEQALATRPEPGRADDQSAPTTTQESPGAASPS